MTTLTYSSSLTVVSCWCGIHCAIPDQLYREAQRSGHNVYCPVGHTFHWDPDDTEAKLRRQLDEERSRTRAARDQADASERQARAARGQVTKIKRRVLRGVCPFCNRSFENVSRHMESKHADKLDEQGVHSHEAD